MLQDPAGQHSALGDVPIGEPGGRPLANLDQPREVRRVRLGRLGRRTPVVRRVRWRRRRRGPLIAPGKSPIVQPRVGTLAAGDDGLLADFTRVGRVHFSIHDEGDAEAVFDDLIDVPTPIHGCPVGPRAPESLQTVQADRGIARPPVRHEAQRHVEQAGRGVRQVLLKGGPQRDLFHGAAECRLFVVAGRDPATRGGVGVDLGALELERRFVRRRGMQVALAVAQIDAIASAGGRLGNGGPLRRPASAKTNGHAALLRLASVCA